jgi:ATP-dependent Lhr-like helicase
MPVSVLHPIVSRWFTSRFAAPTEAQQAGWPQIASGRNVLIAAPTGSGKTLAAFMMCIDRLVRQAVEGQLADATQVVYVSPLKALGNDVQRNLQRPLSEIMALAAHEGLSLPELRALVRTGDTPAGERQAMVRRPPHILVTTPESLYLLLTAGRSRETLRCVQTVIVDEIHALARDKRGSHLALSLERLEALCPRPPVRIGLSATQRPMDEIARFLVGTRRVAADGTPDCAIIDVGHSRPIDLAIETPPTELSAVCSNEQWDEIYTRLSELMNSHRSTLVFVNTRRLAERVAHNLTAALGADAVASHHGSLSKELRLSAEQRLQTGQLKAIVATASLELGIDVGYIDLVCQIGTPRSIATLLQRVGRSGHYLGATPKGRLFPLTRDDLLECLALVRAARQGRLDQVEMPHAPLDILAQQIVAAVAADEWHEPALWELCRGAWPFRNVSAAEFDAILHILSDGIAPGRRQGAYLHRDRIHGKLKARRAARITALTSGGAIPETADYRVVTESGTFVGTVNEDFAIESMAGDVFLLGNTSWRIRSVRGGEVTVSDAQGAPATIPFWLGEAPGRTMELSSELSELREWIAGQAAAAPEQAAQALQRDCGASPDAARQAVQYVAAQRAAIGLIPTQAQIVFERFFDEAGGMQLVIHAPLSSRINRAWGLALRKRFCRSFNFELQAAANDNGIVLSLGPQHSFPLEQMFKMLNPQNGRELLIQALLAAPMFNVRWRWNVTRALAVLRSKGGKKVPPPLQRMKADDLLSAVFPMATACLENVVGDIEVPDHPLVRQTVHDCLTEAMDVERWERLLGDIVAGRVELVPRDTREPSPFCYELLNANPYAFLDDAPLEERRARAVAMRRTLTAADVQELARLDGAAIEQVCREAWPTVRDADELHDALLLAVALPEDECAGWEDWFAELIAAGRVTRASLPSGPVLWLAAENWPLLQAALGDVAPDPLPALPESLQRDWESHTAAVALVRGQMEIVGPTTAQRMAERLGLRASAVQAALEALEGEGSVLRGRFTPAAYEAAGDRRPAPGSRLQAAGEGREGLRGRQPVGPTASGNGSPPASAEAGGGPAVGPLPSPGSPSPTIEFCHRRLLARIHRLTLDAARRQVVPAPPEAYWRFLCHWQHVTSRSRLEGRNAFRKVIEQLQGFEIAGGAWERDILPARLSDYDPDTLDDLTVSGEIAWGRLLPPRKAEDAQPSGAGVTRVLPLSLFRRADQAWLLPPERAGGEQFARGPARAVFDVLAAHGALFFDDLLAATGMLPAQLEDALSELAALGAVTSDGFGTIRLLVAPDLRRSAERRARRRGTRRPYARRGRWSRFPAFPVAVSPHERREKWAWQLLQRYGVVFRDLLAREDLAPRWSELVGVFRRLEAQGKVRGGRFVSNVAGEQYALPEAVEQLRAVRDDAASREVVYVSAADPLNLAGIITPQERLPAIASNTLALQDGRLIGTCQSGEVRLWAKLDPVAEVEVARELRFSAASRLRHQQHAGAVVHG